MPKSDINVTPLIDVLLVLLIIFIVVVPQAPRALDASLPKAADRPEITDATSLVLEVRAEEFLLNATPVLRLRDLDQKLRAAFEARRDATLFIRTADDVRYARLIDAIDTAKGAGATRIGLADANGPLTRRSSRDYFSGYSVRTELTSSRRNEAATRGQLQKSPVR